MALLGRVPKTILFFYIFTTAKKTSCLFLSVFINQRMLDPKDSYYSNEK